MTKPGTDMNPAKPLLAAIGRGHRGMLVIAGGERWCQHSALHIVSALQLSQVTWVGDIDKPLPAAGADKPDHVNAKRIVRIAPQAARSLLGTDSQALVIDARAGLSPDTLGIVSGTLRGGSLLILLTPAFSQWPEFNDPDYQRYRALRPVFSSTPDTLEYKMSGNFIRRFSRAILTEYRRLPDQDHQFLALINEPDSVTPAALSIHSTARSLSAQAGTAPLLISNEQQRVVDQIESLMACERGCIVIEADRGRGKTVALGLATQHLLTLGHNNIVLTAALRSSVDNFFTVIESGGEIVSGGVRFSAVDQLLADVATVGNQPLCDLLLIDEAAAIPLPVLAQLTQSCRRLVFATTTHGYEGSGRGFALRFKAQLEAHFGYSGTGQAGTDALQYLRLTKPMRWRDNDPMEAFFNRLLLLDCDGPAAHCSPDQARLNAKTKSDSTPAKEADTLTQTITVRAVTAAELQENEALLRCVFGLLLDAHYQTRPSDLRQLLDAPFLTLWVAQCEANANELSIVGVCLACEEGGFDPTSLPADQPHLLADIVSGKRRPQGNLLAQSLANLSGDARWCEMRSLRVMRIAVDGCWRRNGIASKLLQALQQYCEQQAFDYWGSSFGFEPALMNFWAQQGAVPVQIGLRLDKASGMRNLMVVKPLNSGVSGIPVATLCLARAQALGHDLGYWAINYLPQAEAAVLESAIAVIPEAAMAPELSDAKAEAWQDRAILDRFLAGEINFDKSVPALCRHMQRVSEPSKPVSAANAQALLEPFSKACETTSALGNHNDGDKDKHNHRLLLASLALAPDWTNLVRQFGFSGRRGAIQVIKTALIRLGNN